jgi:hypothetical protein
MRSRKQNRADDIAALREQLVSVVDSLAKLGRAVGTVERSSYSIKEFLARNGLSESQYHKLKRLEKGPREMRTGSVGVRISAEAERDWKVEREAEAAEGSRALEASRIGLPTKESPAARRCDRIDFKTRRKGNA